MREKFLLLFVCLVLVLPVAAINYQYNPISVITPVPTVTPTTTLGYRSYPIALATPTPTPTPTGPWTEINANAPWSPRAFFSSLVMSDGSIVIMGGGSNDVWRSTDAGATWSEITENAPWSARNRFDSVALPDGSIVLMGGWTGSNFLNDVWWSQDYGASWTQMTANAEWSPRGDFSSLVMPDGSILLIGGTNINVLSSNPDTNYNDVWRSVDNGIRWIQVTSNAEWSPRSYPSVGLMPDGSILLMGGLGNSGIGLNDVWSSTDEGATWKLVTPDAGWPGRYGQSMVVMPDGSIVIIGGLSYIPPYNRTVLLNDVWRSTDGGKTWTEITANAAWSPRYGQSSLAMPDGSIVLMGGSNIANHFNDVWRGELPNPLFSEVPVAAQIPLATSTPNPATTTPMMNSTVVPVTTTMVSDIITASETISPSTSGSLSVPVTQRNSTNATANQVPTNTPGFGIISGVGAIAAILAIRKWTR